MQAKLKFKIFLQGDPKKPLHRCNFYGNTAAGDKLRAMLQMGASRPWMEAMEKVRQDIIHLEM